MSQLDLVIDSHALDLHVQSVQHDNDGMDYFDDPDRLHGDDNDGLAFSLCQHTQISTSNTT